MASLFNTDKGTEIELYRVLNAAGVSFEDVKALSKTMPEDISTVIDFLRVLRKTDLTIQELVKLVRFPEDVVAMVEFVRRRPSFRFIHGWFAPLTDKAIMVKSWPGINPKGVDAAIALAHENGTIAGFEAESPENDKLDLVIVPYRESLAATFLYGRARMMETWSGRYVEWENAYAQGVDDKRVELIPGARPFVPNTIVVQAVDFGANWDPKRGNVLRDVQANQAGQLADFAGLFNASQSPEWVKQMNGTSMPYAILAALLLNVPRYDKRSSSPSIRRIGGSANLHSDRVFVRFGQLSMAVVRKYKS